MYDSMQLPSIIVDPDVISWTSRDPEAKDKMNPFAEQCFQIGWPVLVAQGPTRRLIAISRRPGRPGRAWSFPNRPYVYMFSIYYIVYI